jgi:hypothetical protein
MALETKLTEKRRIRERSLSLKAKLIGAGVGLALAWVVATVSLAVEHGSNVDDQAAADHATTSQTAAETAAQQRLNDGDPVGAGTFARQALTVSPISSRALRSLVLAEQATGHLREASGLLSQAAALGWRDEATQLLLAQASFDAKDYIAAANRIDAVMRVRSHNQPIDHALDQLIVDEKMGNAMSERMALRPDWRSYYFLDTGDDTSDVLKAKAHLIDTLSSSAAPATREETLAVTETMVRVGLISEARDLWFGQSNATKPVLNDPEFQHIPSGPAAPFEWSFPSLIGTTAMVDEGRQGSHSRLHVTTDGSTAGVVARQFIQLAPGPHTLGYQGTDSAIARAAFGWTVRCAPDGAVILFPTLDNKPPYSFTVPAAHCASQFVELRARNTSFGKAEASFSAVELH